jgi:hypothetical protein
MTSKGFFTVQSLRKDGFASELDDLGFGDVFYTFLLQQDKRFARQSVGKTTVFTCDRAKFSTVDFLYAYMSEVRMTDVNAMLDDLQTVYGIRLTRNALLPQIKDSEMYYDEIMDYVYRDYDTYYEDV